MAPSWPPKALTVVRPKPKLKHWPRLPRKDSSILAFAHPARFLRFSSRFGAWLALFLILAGKILSFHGLEDVGNKENLEKYGLQTQATILETLALAKDPHKPSRENTYYFDYQFHPEGQQNEIVIKRQAVSKDLFSRVHKGDSVPVLYLPKSPKITTLELERLGENGKTYLYSGIILLAGGVWWLAYIFLKALRALKARNSIRDYVDATVTAKPRWKFLHRLEYQLESGETHNSFRRLVLSYNKIKIGDTIRIALTDDGPYWIRDLQLADENITRIGG